MDTLCQVYLSKKNLTENTMGKLKGGLTLLINGLRMSFRILRRNNLEVL